MYDPHNRIGSDGTIIRQDKVPESSPPPSNNSNQQNEPSGQHNGLIVFLILFVIIIVLVVGAVALSNRTKASTISTQTSQTKDSSLGESSNLQSSQMSQTAIDSFQASIEKGSRVPGDEVEDEVLILRKKWNDVREKIEAGTFSPIQVSQNTIAYHDGKEIVMIEIAIDSDDLSYGRIYEYSGGKLVFAFVFSANEENRLYFRENNLYRWRYTLGSNEAINYDNTWDNKEYLDWEKFALKEGYDVLFTANQSY